MQDNIFRILADALLAAAGAMARQLNTLNKKPLHPVSLVSGCFIASYMGVMFYFLTNHFQIDGNIAYAAAGLSGWIGPQLLDRLGREVMRIVGIKLDDGQPGSPSDESGKDK